MPRTEEIGKLHIWRYGMLWVVRNTYLNSNEEEFKKLGADD